MWFEDFNHKEYEIVERLGGHAMASTYLGRQVNLGRYVTFRCIHTELERGSQRFANEVAAVASLTHPSNRRMIDAGAAEIEGIPGPYFVFDHHNGHPLSRTLEMVGQLETAEVLRIGRAVLGALAEAHRAGVLHRQIAPETVLLCQHHGVPDHAVLLDFALEQALDPDAWLGVLKNAEGLADFAAPEVLVGDPPSARSDIFSVGAVLYRCAVGAAFSPFADTDVDVSPPEIDQLAGLQADLIEAVDIALDPDPGGRYESATEFLEVLAPIFERAHQAAVIPPSMSTYTQRPVLTNKPDKEDAAKLLTDEPTIWVLAEDPAMEQGFIERIERLAAHYAVATLSPDDAAAYADALQNGEVKQPWLVVFGDLHVITKHAILGALRDLTVTRRMMVSAQLNAQMLEASVNFCGVDKHIVRPVDDQALSEALEMLMADCYRQLQRNEALRHLPPSHTRLDRRPSLTGTFAAETR